MELSHLLLYSKALFYHTSKSLYEIKDFANLEHVPKRIVDGEFKIVLKYFNKKEINCILKSIGENTELFEIEKDNLEALPHYIYMIICDEGYDVFGFLEKGHGITIDEVNLIRKKDELKQLSMDIDRVRDEIKSLREKIKSNKI